MKVVGGLALLLVVSGINAPAEAVPVLCQKRSGAVVVRDPACKKKETPLDLAQFGALGPQGEKGEPGAKGDPGPTLFAHSQNVESNFPITTSPRVVAVAGDLVGADYSGSYSSPLVQPAGTTYMAVSVQAHVANVTGTGVTCTLESRANGGAWTPIAQTAVGSSEGFLNASFPSFLAGTSWAFRLLCQTGSGTGTARGEIGAVGAVPA